MTETAVLAHARQLIVEKWTPDAPQGTGRHCIITALHIAAAGDNRLFWDTVFVLHEIVGHDESLPAWNATHTHDQVIGLFDRALDAALVAA